MSSGVIGVSSSNVAECCAKIINENDGLATNAHIDSDVVIGLSSVCHRVEVRYQISDIRSQISESSIFIRIKLLLVTWHRDRIPKPILSRGGLLKINGFKKLCRDTNFLNRR